MADNIRNSQVADNSSTISNSKNKVDVNIKKIRSETIIISFLVGTVASLIASYVYEHFF